MRDESVSLGMNMGSFLQSISSRDPINYQFSITTTSVDYSGQPTSGIDPGEAGLLLGAPTTIDKTNSDPNTAFQKNLFCEATYWERNSLPLGEGYTCGEDTEEITQAYLDCLCEGTEWDGRAGSGNEEPFEAALLAMCRATESPPEVCYEPISPFDENSVGTNDGMLRQNTKTVIVFFGDEGDNSRRMQQGLEDPSSYLDAFSSLGRGIRIVTIGPNYDEATGDFTCNSGGARTWMVERLRKASEQTEGIFLPLEQKDEQGNCILSDFSQHYEEVTSLLYSFETILALKENPDIETIEVFIDDNEIYPALILNYEEVESMGAVPTYSDGWSYSLETNAITLWGSAVPDVDASIIVKFTISE